MKNKFKAFDLGDLKPFAKGGTSECYRLDQETIVKLYYEGFPLARILMEKRSARAALVAGVPTPISFEMVQVGNRQGLIYEHIQGKTLSELTAEAPEKAVEMGEMMAEIGRTLHHAPVIETELPMQTTHIRAILEKIDYAPEKTIWNISKFMDTLEMEHQYVHGDFHLNNIIVTRNGPVLIDMGGFSVGCPLFDLASLRFSLFESPEARKGGRSAFNGLNQEEAQNFWRGFEKAYFGGEMDPQVKRKLYGVTLLKMLWFERMYWTRFSAEYIESVRQMIASAFVSEWE